MTIVSIAFVPDGIAMAADSRLTGTRINANAGIEYFTVTDNAQKLVLIRESTVGVSFYGDAIINGKTVSDILRVFGINEVNNSDTVDIISNKLQQYLSTHYTNSNVAFLVAGFDNDIPYVYNVDKNTVVLMNYDAQNNLTYGASWRGEADTFNRLFKGVSLNPELMPLKDAVDLAEFIVETTIKCLRFEDRISTCGGSIDLLVITKDYAKFVKHKILVS